MENAGAGVLYAVRQKIHMLSFTGRDMVQIVVLIVKTAGIAAASVYCIIGVVVLMRNHVRRGIKFFVANALLPWLSYKSS